jgi:predicted metal-binding membrane protein
MDAMAMRGGGTLSTAWMPRCGGSGTAAATSFLEMWDAMMGAMMLPSLVPTLWCYRRALTATGRAQSAWMTALVAGGYFLVWTLLGATVYPLGVALEAAVTR